MKTTIFCFLLFANYLQAQVSLSGNATFQGDFTIGATPNKVFLLFDVPNQCAGGGGFTPPLWQPNTLYYGVAVTQLGNAWVQNGGRFYRNETGGSATSGNKGGPTCTSGVCPEGDIIWRYKPNTILQCGDEIAHYVLPKVDGVTLLLPWGADNGNATGFETSNGGNTASAGYSFANFDATVTNSGSTGILDNPNWPAAGRIAILAVAISSPVASGNTLTPNYVFSTTWATNCCSAAPLDVNFTPSYAGKNNGGTLPLNAVANINIPGMELATLTTGWPGMFEGPASKAWKYALANQIAHHGAVSWHSKIAFERIGGIGTGGETFMPGASNWKMFLGQDTRTLKATWTSYIKSIFDAATADNPPFPLEAALNCGGCALGDSIIVEYTWSDLEAQYAQAENPKWMLGDNGASQSDIDTYAVAGAAPGSGISGDRAYIWATYPSVGKVFQTIAYTDPTGTGVGSLVSLLPFQQQLCAHANSCTFEAFWQDLCVAWCPNYVNYPAYHAAYAAVLDSFTLYGNGN